MQREDTARHQALTRVRGAIAVIIVGLFISGVTVFPAETEIRWFVNQVLEVSPQASARDYTGLTAWLVTVRDGLHRTNTDFPWIAYGYDWLAFAHILLAILFLGPYRDPVKNIWVIEFGLLACCLVFPLALICGPLRGIPFYWRLIDCAFGVVAFFPLWYARRITLTSLAPESCPRTEW